MHSLPVSLCSLRRMAAGCLLAAGVLFAGCGPRSASESTAPGAPARIVLGAILFQEDQFYRLIEQGMQDAAKQHGAELLVSNSSGSLDKEISLIENYTAQGVKALLIAPLSATSSVPALQRTSAEGIPIITVDGALDADFPKEKIRSSQEQLGRSTGEAAREYITTHLGGKATIGMIEYISLAPEISRQRVDGFKSALKDMPEVRIVAEQDAWQAPQAADVVDGILTAHQDVNLIWAANEGGTVGAITAVRNRQLGGKVVVFGTDMSDQIGDFLQADDNILQAVTGQKPYDIGRTSVENALKLLAGETLVPLIELPGVLFKRGETAAIQQYQTQLRQLTQ